MLLRNRSPRRDTLVFNGGLPDVQINDPRSPLAEALAQLTQGVGQAKSIFAQNGGPAAAPGTMAPAPEAGGGQLSPATLELINRLRAAGGTP